MIYFVRHGQTNYNRQGYIQGHLDIPLNEEGLRQANVIAEKLKNVKIDVIYSSPLVRAKVTAETINKHHSVSIICDDRLKELNAGSLQGRKFKELNEEEKTAYFTDPTVFGAESYDELCDRVESIYKELEKENKNILIVAHGGVYRSIVKYIKHLDSISADIPPLDNCEVVNLDDIK